MLGTGEQKVLTRMVSVQERKDIFDHCTELYLRRARLQGQWKEVRDLSLQELPFPFTQFRAGQRQLAGEVYRTMRRGAGVEPLNARDKVLAEMSDERNCAQLFASAPTGIGKTMAVLYPALKAMGEGYCARLFYFTARTIARTVAEEALERMRGQGLLCKAVTLTARDKICFMEQAICDPDYCPFAKGYLDRVREGLEDIFQNESAFTRPIIETYARKHTLCPFELGLDLTLWCDVIICDYNYLFDPTVYLRRFFQESTNDHGFLIDEAHNLVDRGREMYSAQLSGAQVDGTCKALRARQKDEKGFKGPTAARNVLKPLADINKWLKTMKKIWEQPIADVEKPNALLPMLNLFVEAAEQWLMLNQYTSHPEDDWIALEEAVSDVYYTCTNFLRTVELFDERYITLCWREFGYANVKLWCMDPSKSLAGCMEKGMGAVLFSATLTPMNYFYRLLGGHDMGKQMVLPSPFPHENLCIMVHRGISTRYKDRENTLEPVADAIARLVTARQGNYLVFFPSHRYMQDVVSVFTDQHPDIDIIMQQDTMDEEARQAFLDAFDADNPNTMVGWAVMGGIFGEGIDLVGDRLCGTVIVGVGLPQICLERDVIREYFDGMGDGESDGYAFAYRYPGMNKVLQAVGRVIRSETDRGVALLIDDRFVQPIYHRLYPSHWHPHICSRNTDITRIVKQFWR